MHSDPSQHAVVGLEASQHPPPTSGMPAKQLKAALPHILKAKSVWASPRQTRKSTLQIKIGSSQTSLNGPA